MEVEAFDISTTTYTPSLFSAAYEELEKMEGRQVLVSLGRSPDSGDERFCFTGTLPRARVFYYHEDEQLLRYEFDELTQFTISEKETERAWFAEEGGVILEFITGMTLSVSRWDGLRPAR